MGDKLDNKPNIPLHKKKISAMVSEDAKSEETLPVSNIPWLHKSSVHTNRSHTHNDGTISDRGSAFLCQPPNVEAKYASTVETFPNNSDIPMAENNVPFHPKITSTEHSREPNTSRDDTYSAATSHDIDLNTPDQEQFPGQHTRPKEDFEPVLDSGVPGVNPSSKGKHKYDDVGFENSNSIGRVKLQQSSDSIGTLSEESTCFVSDNHVIVDGKSTSLVITEVDLQTLLHNFQDILQQANDLQRRNETFLHNIRHEDRTSCEALQRRITETRDNFTSLESRIEDGDKEIKLLEEKIEPIVHKIDSLCKSFEKRTSEQNAMAFRRDKTIADNHRHLESNVLGAEGDRQRVRQSHRENDNTQMKYSTGSRLQTSSIRKDEGCRSKLDKKATMKTRVSGTEDREGHCMKVDVQAKSDETKRQTVVSSSETKNNTDMDRIPQKNDKRPERVDDVTKRHEAKQRIPRKNRSDLKSESSGKRSESESEPRVRDEDKSTRPRPRRKLKCSELGFKYRKTNPGVDNRIKVVRNDVILRGGPTSHITDNNIKSRDPRKSSLTNTGGAEYEPHEHFFGVHEDLDVLSVQSDLSAMGIDGAIRMTETDVKASNRWVVKANEERRKGSALAPYRGKGPDTVLLLDTSESMRGRPFNDMIRIAKQIIEGIQNIHTRIGIQENIGISVFGHETTVLRHLTLDYMDLLSSLDTLTAGGPSPLSAGFVMGLAALLGNASGITSVKNIPLSPRVILISDGNATLDSSFTEERSSENTLVTSHIRLLLLPVLKDYEKRGNRVFCVPVGDANMVHFEDICRVTKGRIYPCSDVQRLVKMTQAEVTAIEMYEGLKGNNRQQMLDILTADSLYHPNVQHDAEDIVDYVEYLNSRESSVSGIELPMHIEQDPNMPPIGTRVRRGPSWKWNNQDTEGPGTVIGHQKNGMIWIEWDNGFKNRYHYHRDAYDVKVVDEPRQVLGDQLIATGYLVKRGIDWTYGDQDGGQGNIGIVFLVKENGMVGVRWPSGNTGFYKYGAEGRFDIDICDPTTNPRPLVQTGRETSSNVANVGNNTTTENLSRPAQRNDPPQENRNLNTSRTIESYLPSVEEMNKKNASSLRQASQTSSHFEERDVSESAGSDDVKSSAISDTPGTNYLVKWQYSDSEGNFHDYPGNVNGKIEATYIKRPGGTVIINVDGVGYRILFTKMQQVEINTKATVTVRRTVLA